MVEQKKKKRVSFNLPPKDNEAEAEAGRSLPISVAVQRTKLAKKLPPSSTPLPSILKENSKSPTKKTKEKKLIRQIKNDMKHSLKQKSQQKKQLKNKDNRISNNIKEKTGNDNDDDDADGDSETNEEHNENKNISSSTRDDNDIESDKPNVSSKKQSDNNNNNDEEEDDDDDDDSDSEDDDDANGDIVQPGVKALKEKASKDAIMADNESDDDDGENDSDDDNMNKTSAKSTTTEMDVDNDADDKRDDDLRNKATQSNDSDKKKSTTMIDPAEEKAFAEENPKPVHMFSELSLDPRLERAIERAGWRKPTSVQAAVIPTALYGRDVLVSAPTGSGKTAAYGIPIVQHVCRARASVSNHSGGNGNGKASSTPILAVVLVPTRELVHQVTVIFKNLCRFIDGIQVSSVVLDKKKNKKQKQKRTSSSSSSTTTNKTNNNNQQQQQLLYRPADIIVGTPAAINALQTQHVTGSETKNPLHSVQMVVVDEADLVLSYGYERDTRQALDAIPTAAQAMMLSATLDTEGIDSFRTTVLRRPLTVKVSADDDNSENADNEHKSACVGATHYLARLNNIKDRYLVTYAMLRLNVLCGKVLIFVNHIVAAFRLKLFLDQFKVKSAVLNSELPANSRIHCVQQFNAGIFDILIAADELNNIDSSSSKNSSSSTKQQQQKNNNKKRARTIDKDEEFGLSRGIDFKDVAVVLNFDRAQSVESYTHRAGRTARGGKSGTVLTLACSSSDEMSTKFIGDEIGIHIGPLAFRMEQIEAFRYRVEDSLRLVSDSAVHGARLADVRREMMNSEQLKGHFEENPDDFMALQHNLRLAKNVSDHLGHIPSYLLPPGMRNEESNPANTSGAVKRWQGEKKNKKRGKQRGGKGKGKKVDPLKGFSVGGSSKISKKRRGSTGGGGKRK